MRIATVFGILAMSAGLALAQAPAQPTSTQSPTLAAGTRVNAELKSRLDTQHAKVGDKVTAVTTSDVKEHGVKVIPKGSTLTGHVTEVTAAESSKSPSRIGVLFDQAETKNGQPIALRAGIASVLTSTANTAMDMGMGDGMAMPMPQPAPSAGTMGGGGLGGIAAGAAATVDAGVGAATPSATLGEQPVPALVTAPNAEIASIAHASNGAPIRILMPAASATASQQTAFGSVLSTPRGDLKLNSGTRVQLQIMN